MKIVKVEYNWHVDPDNEAVCDYFALGEASPGFLSWGVVTNIEESICGAECDKHWLDVCFDSGRSVRIFNPNFIIRYPSE